jgi:uncharacterized membrane protein YgcG
MIRLSRLALANEGVSLNRCAPVLILLIALGLGWQTPLFAQQLLVTDIQSPRPNGWIVDFSETVSDEAVENINRVCQEINERLGREMCVVVVPSTHGVKHRDFATKLFNHWGVGKPGIPGAPGVWRDNGIMLFVATGQARRRANG